MCVGTSCSQQFYTERGRGAWERSSPPSGGIEIIKRSCDSGVSITAHTGPENQTKSPYLLQTHIHKRKGGKNGFLYFRKILVYFFFLWAELLNILELHPVSLMLWQCHDTLGEGHWGGRASASDSVCESLTYPFLAKIITPLFWGWSHGTGCFFLVNVVPFLTDWIPYLSFVFSV